MPINLLRRYSVPGLLNLLQPVHLTVRDRIRHPRHLLGHSGRHSVGPQVPKSEGPTGRQGTQAKDERE